jgi:3-dehydroquinate dehydratase-1
MSKPKICAVIVSSDFKSLEKVEPLFDLYEVRIDLIGAGWKEIVPRLGKPWIATNRTPEEGGKAAESETERVKTLLSASKLGANIIDIELRSPELTMAVPLIKKRSVCLISYHDFKGTPPFGVLKEIIKRQIVAGADICKVVTTARSAEDNLTVLKLIKEFPGTRVVALTMGDLGLTSRVLCPVLGGDFTYASLEKGRESAPGQMTVSELRQIYEMFNG